MLLSVVVAALVGAMPCNLSLLAPATSPARLQASAPAGLLQEGDCEEAAPPSPGTAWGRGATGALGGVLGSAAGALVGGLIGNAVGDCGSECWFGSGELWVGALIGLHLGAGLGAHLTGNLMGGRGTWVGTVLGTLGGGLLGVLMLTLVASMDDSRADGLLVVPLFMPAIGAATGYALSEPATPGPCVAPEQFRASRTPALRLRFSF